MFTPAVSNSTAVGYLKVAATPVPSLKLTVPLPASVVRTSPGQLMTRTLWEKVSATAITLPAGFIPRPFTLLVVMPPGPTPSTELQATPVVRLETFPVVVSTRRSLHGALASAVKM